MNTYTDENLIGADLDDIAERIKQHLKQVLPKEVYDNWIDNFVFESISRSKIVIGYYGSDSLKDFEENYKEFVWIQICSIAGYSKKLEVHKRKHKTASPDAAKRKKNLNAAKWFFLSLIFLGITLAVALVAQNYILNRNFTETFYSVSSLKANNKIRVIQISDLHDSLYGKDNEKLSSRVEKLSPDIIILTGDCIDASDDTRERTVSLCKHLAETAPTYYVYGNNEDELFYDVPLTQTELDEKFGFDDENRDPSKLTEYTDEFELQLEEAGVTVLKNQSVTQTVGNTAVDIYGVLTSNPSAFWTYSDPSYQSYIYDNPENLKIMAIHEPFIFETFTPPYSWGDLMVCGHTHGGAARIPVLGPLYTHEGGLLPERKGYYVYGRYEVAGSPLIVSAGLANNNFYRINNQPELVIIDINKF